jgi:hypothetical protein
MLTWFTCADVHQEGEDSDKESPENNAQYTTVYVGNLAHEVNYYVILYSSRVHLYLLQI